MTSLGGAARGWRTALKGAAAGLMRARRRTPRAVWAAMPELLRPPHEVVTDFDLHAYEHRLIEDVSAVLDQAGVDHLVLDQRFLDVRRVVIPRSDLGAARSALARDPSTTTLWMAPALPGWIGAAVPMRSRLRFPGATGLLLSRNSVTPRGVPLMDSETGIMLELWARLDRAAAAPGGGIHHAGTLQAPVANGVLDDASPGLWSEIQRNRHRLPARLPHLLELREPVDVVYTWVDGSDPSWQARKAAAVGGDTESGTSADASIPARFESRDELRYSLRSLEMYANWVRRIWIVTDAQIPPWLRQDDRLRVVDHREIFTDPGALPVFNSHAIESQLHHIPGLAEHYLYLNDDMFFGGRVTPEDFFHGNGISKFFTSPALIDIGGNDPRDLAVTAAAKNNRTLIESEFSRTITHKLRHTPQPQVRSVIQDFEDRHPDVFDSVMRSRLRHASNYSLPSSLSQYHAFALGRAVPGRLEYGYVDLATDRPELTLEQWLRSRHLQTFCINDSGDPDPRRRVRTDRALREVLEAYFPLPSRWERP